MIHEIIKSLLKNIEYPTIFEVGARKGEDTAVFAQNFPLGSLYVFEPLPEHLSNLEQVAEWSGANIYQKALSNTNGVAKFYVSSDPAGFNGSSSLKEPKEHLVHFPHVSFNNIIDVETITLDKFCQDNKINKIDFIWLDAQRRRIRYYTWWTKNVQKCSLFI